MSVFNLLKNRIEEMEERGDVDGLIHALNDDAENVRREAVMALERIGDTRATEPLIQTLQDPDKTIQEEVITALGRIQDKKAVPPLIQTLNNQHIGIRWRAAEALGKIGDPQATEPLIQTLQDPDKTIQEEVITALGRIQDKKAVPPLIQTLNNQHIGIRWRAAEALGKIGDPQATEPLIQTLQDPDKTIQEEVITALGRIAVNPFIQDLIGEDQKVRDGAIIALNHLRELKVTRQEELSKQVEFESDKEISDENINTEVQEEIRTDTKSFDKTSLFESAEKPDFNVKRKNLIKNGYHVYITNFVKNSRYNYLDGFSRKSRYDYEFLDIRKLRELLKYRGIDFSDEEVLWLIQEEIKNQEYLEFKEKILAQTPETITDYLEILIKTYKEPKNQTEHLKKLLKQQNILHNELTEDIEKTQKQMEITEFENKILFKEAQTPDEKDSPSILKEFRKKELEENRELMRKNGKYTYIENLVKKSRYNYEFGDNRKFKELLHYKGMNFSDDDLLWLIQEEIKNQEYLEFKEKILAQTPETITDYLEILIKTYKEPKNQTEHLKKLLKQQNIPHNPKLKEEMEKTQKQMEITEFENKILNKKVSESVLPIDMEDLDEAYISYNLGNLFYEIGKLEKALSYYDRALYIYPEFIDAWKNRGLMYYTLGRLQKAAACYNQILHLDPEYPELWVDIGIIFFEMGHVGEAKDCYEKAMELNPCYQSEDLAVETRNFLENRPISLKNFDSYLELASSAWWESSDPTPPMSRIMRFVNKNFKD